MKANQAEFRTILRAAVPMVVGLALSSYATASFALGTAEQRVACTPDVFRLCSSEIPNVRAHHLVHEGQQGQPEPGLQIRIRHAHV